MHVNVDQLKKKFGDFAAVNDCSFHAGDGELLTLLGPSGCGKTTLLRMIAGLLVPDSGKIIMGENEVTTLPPQKRNTAMVFQHYALFPNLTVHDNVAFGLKAAKAPKAVITQKVQQALELVELTGYESRRIDELSGGQRQRVALARALAIEPAILLLDEPLSNLDEALRQSMRQSIRSIQQSLGITTIYVTHDQEEAMSISDRIAVMEKGIIRQIGTPDDIYQHPANRFVADFIGQANLLPVQISRRTEHKAEVELFGRTIAVAAPSDLMPGSLSHLMIRPEEIVISDLGIPAIVVQKEHLGAIQRFTLDVQGKSLILDRLNRYNEPRLIPGSQILFTFAEESLVLLPD